MTGESAQTPSMQAKADPLAMTFLAHLSPAVSGAYDQLPNLEASLQALVAQAQGIWPEIFVAPAVFVAYLATRLASASEAGTTLETIHAAELYLLCGFELGDARALDALDRFYMSKVAMRLARRGVPPATIEDIVQTLYQRLLPSDAADPRQARYSGRGELLGWIHVAAVREARKASDREARLTSAESDCLADLSSPDESHETAYMKRKYRGEFKAAFHSALASLSARERNLLRHNLLDGINIDQLGETYGVHRATVARWIARTREKLLAFTRENLLRTAGGEGAEIESIVGLIQSQLDVSIRRVLGPEHEADEVA